jgi:hypothetical protein
MYWVSPRLVAIMRTSVCESGRALPRRLQGSHAKTTLACGSLNLFHHDHDHLPRIDHVSCRQSRCTVYTCHHAVSSMSGHFHRLAHSTTHEYFHSDPPNEWGVCFTIRSVTVPLESRTVNWQRQNASRRWYSIRPTLQIFTARECEDIQAYLRATNLPLLMLFSPRKHPQLTAHH